MTKIRKRLLYLCLKDQVFCSIYGGLYYMQSHHSTSEPLDVWIKTLQIRHDLAESPRPDMILDMIINNDVEEKDRLCVLFTLLFILTAEDMNDTPTELKTAIVKMINHYENWEELYKEIRWSEESEELKGRFINGWNFPDSDFPIITGEAAETSDVNIIHQLVDEVLKSKSEQLCQALELIIRRMDNMGKYREETERLMNANPHAATVNNIYPQTGSTTNVSCDQKHSEFYTKLSPNPLRISKSNESKMLN